MVQVDLELRLLDDWQSKEEVKTALEAWLLHKEEREVKEEVEQRLDMDSKDVKPMIIDTKKENEYYGDVIVDPFDIIRATVCNICNEKFQHTTKLLYHMLHLHKVNPVHFINKHLRAKPVR